MTTQPTGITALQLAVKTPTESRTLPVDFYKQLNGATISSVGDITQVIDSTNAAPAEADQLTIGDPVISGTKVLVNIQGGTDGTIYALIVPIVPSTFPDDSWECRCRLQVSIR